LKKSQNGIQKAFTHKKPFCKQFEKFFSGGVEIFLFSIPLTDVLERSRRQFVEK
jgi:hypothetical protein